MGNQIFVEYYEFIEWKIYNAFSESYEFLGFKSRLSVSKVAEKWPSLFAPIAVYFSALVI